MTADAEGDTWSVIGFSVRGGTHARAQLPNQDALAWLPQSAAGPPLAVAVADGHGSVKCFRSQIGSQFAVEAATQLLEEFLVACAELDLTVMKRTAEEKLPGNLTRMWRDRVLRHLEESPISHSEWEALAQHGGPRQAEVEANPLLAYGSTVLAVGISRSFLIYLQLGDGDMLAVSADGDVQFPISRDGRYIANETASLCGTDAQHEFRCAVQVNAQSRPVLITLSTDGYSNCFVSEADFRQVGGDLLKVLRAGGVPLVTRSLQAQLDNAANRYSGDDVTLAVLHSSAALLTPPVEHQASATQGQDDGSAPT